MNMTRLNDVTEPDSYRYLAYLVRLWREGDENPWRVTLKDPHTGERRTFANLHHFIDFLEEQTGEDLRHVA